MKNTLVINLIGGPGVGKSTMMAAVFARLKDLGVDCEMCNEFAKQLVWEMRYETFKDELYIFAKQAHAMFRLNGKVDVVVTDRPLILTCHYAKSDEVLCNMCYTVFQKYNNINYVLTREKAYNSNGRNQSEDEAREIDTDLKTILDNYHMNYKEIPGNMKSVDIIVNDVLKLLGKEE